MTKKELRKQLLDKRKAITLKDWENRSKRIHRHILKSEVYQKSETIHIYLSMNDRREVDTIDLINRMLEDRKTIVVPVTDFKTTTLRHSVLQSLADLQMNKWGVKEPAKLKEISIDQLDLVLVPLLGADKKGNRLGYGKGFYDRFLEMNSSPSFGLIFDEFITDFIPTEIHDVPLDGLISESGLIYCNKGYQ